MSSVPEPPDEPKDVKITDFDKESVTLKWKHPEDDGGLPITGTYRNYILLDLIRFYIYTYLYIFIIIVLFIV